MNSAQPVEPPSQRRFDGVFRFAVVIKALDGFLELVGGILLIFVSQSTLQGIIASLTDYELDSGQTHAFITDALNQLDAHVSNGTQFFLALYLLGHGAIKILLMIALVKQKYRLYPVAIVFLLIFIFYQAYLIGYSHSILLTIFTAFDCFLTWMTYQEWRRHQPAPTLTT
jgi:uncharacterized membrane protein